MSLRPLALALAILLGLGNFANGVYMLVDPSSWYFAVPGVTTTGPSPATHSFTSGKSRWGSAESLRFREIFRA